MLTTSKHSNHHRIKIFLSALLLLFGLISCGGFKAFQKPFEEEGSLVIGYIDAKDAPSDFRWINMKQINPEIPTGKYGFFVEKGLFYRTYVPNDYLNFTNLVGIHTGWVG